MRSVWNRLSAITPRQFGVALALVIVAVSIQYTVKVLDLRNGKQDRSAILRWREQLLQLDSGDNIYEHFTYPNPPIMAMMLRPLAELPPIAGALTWYYLKVALAVLSFALIVRMIGTEEQPFPTWAIGLAVLLSLRTILSDLTHGNVNLLIMFLVIASLFAYRSKWDVSAGIVLALAIACKVTPALFVGYWIWKRAWRAIAGCGIGLILFFFVFPSLYLGWSENLELLTSWFRQMVLPYVVGGNVTTDHPNQSLPGLVFRLLTFSPSFSTYINDIYTPVEYCNWLSLSPQVAGWIVKACMATFVGLVVWVCRTPTGDRRDWRMPAEAAIIILGMLLFSERTWKHHCVTLALPFAVLCHRLAYEPNQRGAIVTALVISQILISTTSTGLLTNLWAEMAQVYGAFVGAFVVLLVALAGQLRRSSLQAVHVSARSIKSAA
jgi:energy-coupling factor transporter transmembrane protein EcfT